MRTGRFTLEELEIAKSADLCHVAEALGYTIKRVGSFHTLKEMDSVRIYHRKSWCRFSRLHDSSGRGGFTIDFLKEFAGMDIKEAVDWLLDFMGYANVPETKRQKEKLPIVMTERKETEKKKLILPPPAKDNGYLYSYLHKERAICKSVIDFFVDTRLIYEERNYHNIVFQGRDKEGMVRFASMRGVFDQKGKAFKCDVAGSDKAYGFHVVQENSVQVVVLEAAIDVMSYADIFSDANSSLLALGMLSDAPLKTFLSEYPQIRQIRFCLDNDLPGRKAAEKLMQKYKELGYQVEDRPPPKPYKDYNEWLQERKKEQLEGQEKEKLSEKIGSKISVR